MFCSRIVPGVVLTFPALRFRPEAIGRNVSQRFAGLISGIRYRAARRPQQIRLLLTHATVVCATSQISPLMRELNINSLANFLCLRTGLEVQILSPRPTKSAFWREPAGLPVIRVVMRI
jgi:hypothetical protein